MSDVAATSARLLVLLPAVAALAGLLVVRHGRPGRDAHAARDIAVGASGLALLAAVLQLVAIGDRQAPERIATLPSLKAGELAIPLELQTAGWVALMAFIVAVVGLAVQVYAAWYLADDDRYEVFAASVSLFLAGMLLVVQSGDLVLTLVGWEVMGWCSYLLIGHWSRRESARRAALKAFLVTRLADVGFTLGVVILAAGPGSTAYGAVLDFWTSPAGACPDAGACIAPDPTLRSLALVLLIVGIVGKSAQFPFHDWLPDAMEGPTPASALIHAATMVAAGTVILAQLFPVLVLSDPARWVLAATTCLTMVGAALLAFGQTDLKRLLAYSTISQVAVMLSALAAAPAAEGPGAGLLQLYSHAIFKSLLFLAIGWLGVLAGGTTARMLRGSAAQTPLLRVAWAFGLMALAGVPVTVGGVSKEQVIGVAEAGAGAGDARATLVYGVLLLTVILTAAYATRAYLVVTPTRVPGQPGAVAPVPISVVLVVGGLVGLTVLGGLAASTGVLGLNQHVNILMVVFTTALIAVGAFVAYVLAGGLSGATADPAERVLGARMARFDAGFGADTAYRVLVAVPVVRLARLAAFLDTEVIDAYVRGGAGATRLAGRAAVRAHLRPRSSTGLVWVVLGVAVLAALGVAAR